MYHHGLLLVAVFSSICQINRPEEGIPWSKPFCCRFSIRKYSFVTGPSLMRMARFSSFASGILTAKVFEGYTVGVSQPFWIRKKGFAQQGALPSLFQLPPDIRHQLPSPFVLFGLAPSRSYKSGQPMPWPYSWQNNPMVVIGGVPTPVGGDCSSGMTMKSETVTRFPDAFTSLV